MVLIFFQNFCYLVPTSSGMAVHDVTPVSTGLLKYHHESISMYFIGNFLAKNFPYSSIRVSS